MKPTVPREYGLRDFIQVFQRRGNIFWTVVASFALLGLLAYLITPKMYIATGTIELETPQQGGLGRDSLMGDAPASSDPLASDVAIQTQSNILQSDALALRTMQALQSQTHTGTATSLFSYLPSDPSHSRALAAFHKALTVKPIAGTKLVQVSFANNNPQMAAAVVNELVRQLTLFGEEQTSKATDEAAGALSKELEGLRSQSEALQKQVASMQSQTGLYEEGSVDGHSDQAYSAVIAQFQRAAGTLSDATQNKILKDSIYRVARTGDPEQISSLAGNAMVGSNSGFSNSLGTIENLRVSESQMQTQLDQLRVKFGPDYPKVAELQAGIASTEQSIKAETKRIMQRAQTDAAIADQTWQSAQDNYNSLKAQADSLNNKTVNYRITMQEADESRTLYTDLLKKLKEAGVLQGLHSTNILPVDVAVAPHSPARPSFPIDLAAGLGAGIIFGLIMVMAVELLDDRILEYESVEELGLRLIGIVPRLLGGNGISVDDEVLTIYHHAIRKIRTDFAGSQVSTAARVIVVVPTTPGDNCRQIALSLTGSATKAGQKVLFVEGSTTREIPRLIGPRVGPALLTGETSSKGETIEPNLPIVCHLSMETAADGTPLVEHNEQMRARIREWRNHYDMVVVEASAQMFDATAAVLCDHADAVLQVVTYGQTKKTSLQRSSALLYQSAGKKPNVVIQDVPVRSAAFTNYYGCSPVLNKA